ncbi:MAG: hypothetical protein NC300_07275 [Bacteroidales bacterium]|nr:hypothetical protein [Clostridium sp.]MCM1203928.1 hypothetical protein [Bacteroidales bacterium]
MARDLSFWKTKQKQTIENSKIYVLLSDEETVEGLENLPADKILNDIKTAFADWLCDGNTYFEKGDESFELMITEQFVRFDCYGITEEHMNQMIDIMLEYGCPLYDSSIDVRFEA